MQCFFSSSHRSVQAIAFTSEETDKGTIFNAVAIATMFFIFPKELFFLVMLGTILQKKKFAILKPSSSTIAIYDLLDIATFFETLLFNFCRQILYFAVKLNCYYWLPLCLFQVLKVRILLFVVSLFFSDSQLHRQICLLSFVVQRQLLIAFLVVFWSL